MIDKNNIISAVSPLKRKKSYKGGTKVKKAATKTAKRRGGFAESTATSNKPGYNVKTSFVARGGKVPTGTKTAPQKPYSYDKDGNIQVNPMATKKWTDPVTDSATTERTLKKSKSGVEIGSWDYDNDGMPSYTQAWDKNLENVQDKYTSLKDYISKESARKDKGEKGASKKEIESSIYETKTVTKQETTPGYWTYYDEDGGKISKEEYSKYKKKK